MVVTSANVSVCKICCLKRKSYKVHWIKSMNQVECGPADINSALTLDMANNLGAEDGAATLTAFTARSIAKARDHFPESPREWIVCGGGRHNPTLMRELRAVLPNVITGEDAGWRGDFIEAEAFAYLAVRSLRGLPISFPMTTGVRRAMSGGALSTARL